jgi:uncharacterized membrane protein YqhA
MPRPQTAPRDPRLRPLPQLIFASRWLQLSLYLGLKTTIHIAFLLSAMAIAAVDRILPTPTHVREMDAANR